MTLDQWLTQSLAQAKLSLEELCQRTKIQTRFVRSLENGDFASLPSNTHLRAFAMAHARACGVDEARTAELVRLTLEAVAPPQKERTRFAAEAPKPAPAKPATLSTDPKGIPPALVPAPAQGWWQGGSAAPAPIYASASSAPATALERLRSIPWPTLAGLALGAGALTLALYWLAGVLGPVAPAPRSGVPALAPASGQAPAAATSADSAAPAPLAPSSELVLRARRPCWLVLEVDGQRLPTVMLKDGDKRSWSVRQKAVLLAGNLGALRVWWLGDNLGYLGELGERANALVFEPGHVWRRDKAEALDLPAGVPD